MTQANNKIETLDVAIIGAGLSGIGMGCQLKEQRSNDSFVMFESRDAIGGTWDLFRYPGIRSDSDMYTFAYSFKPWTDAEMIGTGERIRDYLNEVVDDYDLRKHIRFKQRVTNAAWDSTKARWVLTVEQDDADAYTVEAKFLLTCTGYYNYEHGYVPEFEGFSDYSGEVIYPQKWPQEFDYRGKRVVVIGSGATAVTVVPAMAEEAAHVTMLQRSPTYVVSVPSKDLMFKIFSKVLPKRLTNRIMRAKYIALQQLIYTLSKRFPALVRKWIRYGNKKALGDSVAVDPHFKPNYKPWDQRMCMVPDEDLFKAMREGKASIVTDEIARFTSQGIELKSGENIEADIVVPATGLDVQFWGGMNIQVDGNEVNAAKLTNYKGMMFSQMPNFVTIFGYTNAPWTLKAELTYSYVCKLLNYMDKQQHDVVYPYLDREQKSEILVDLKSTYVMRAADRLPQQGEAFPWRNKDFYLKDIFAIKYSELADGVLKFDDARPLAVFHAQKESA